MIARENDWTFNYVCKHQAASPDHLEPIIDDGSANFLSISQRISQHPLMQKCFPEKKTSGDPDWATS